ncbi:hypothetical protein [Parvibaculum sp.]|uniref:hypothetical protein n=1 Tax=Parvibaculum sp. TaxID=2024848 RepID=UPI003BA89DC9
MSLVDSGWGEVQIQQFGQPDNVLIRVQSPQGDDAEKASQAVVQQIKSALGDGVEYRRVEVVGPQVSGELVQDGILAIVVSVALMLIYIWFRFEWQFSLGSVIALVHDVMATLALFLFAGHGVQPSVDCRAADHCRLLDERYRDRV